MPIKSKKLRDSAKGQECTFNIVGVCNYNPETVVLCHINTEGGKMGGKTDDISAAFGCSDCHFWIDQNQGSEEESLFYKLRALIRTHLIWIEQGLMCIK